MSLENESCKFIIHSLGFEQSKASIGLNDPMFLLERTVSYKEHDGAIHHRKIYGGTFSDVTILLTTLAKDEYYIMIKSGENYSSLCFEYGVGDDGILLERNGKSWVRCGLKKYLYLDLLFLEMNDIGALFSKIDNEKEVTEKFMEFIFELLG